MVDMVYHLSSSNLVFLSTCFNHPKGEFFLGGKTVFLLAKCRPKGGENIGRQILGGKVGKEADFGGRKKTIHSGHSFWCQNTIA